MALPKDGEVQLFQVVDTDGNPARVAVHAGVYRLAVDAIITAGGVFTTDTDDDSIAAGQTLLAVINENYAFGGTTWNRVQSRGAVADQAYTLQRTLVDSVIRGDDGADYAPMAVRADFSGVSVSTLIGLLTASVLHGVGVTENVLRRIGADLPSSISGTATGNARAYSLFTAAIATGIDNTGAAVLRPVEARDFSADTDVVSTLIGLLVNSRTSILRRSTGEWARLYGDVGDAVGGIAPGTIIAAYTHAINVGIDSTGAAVMRQVEARDQSVDGDLASTLIGFLVNARLGAFNITTGDYARLTSTDANSSNVSQRSEGLHVYEARESAFSGARRGRRFYATHQTPTTSVTAQATFVATTPTILLRQNAASVRVIARSIRIVITSATAAPVDIVVAIDTADRFSAGGTSHTPQNTNEESATASGITSFLTNPTATAAGGGTRYLVNDRLPSGNAASITITFKDGVLLSTTAALLVYLFDSAGLAAPTYFWTMEWEEVA